MLVASPHTTAGVTVNEGYDPDVAGDLVRRLERLAPREGQGDRHAEGNSDAHLAVALVGTSVRASRRRQTGSARPLAADLPARVGRAARAPAARLEHLGCLAVAVELRDVDLALASYPEGEWAALAAPVLLARLRDASASTRTSRTARSRRASYLAAAAGDPESGDDPDGPAVLAIADELHTRERAARAVRRRSRRVRARDRGAPPARPARAARARSRRRATIRCLTWRLFCAALYVAELADEDDGGAAEDAP